MKWVGVYLIKKEGEAMLSVQRGEVADMFEHWSTHYQSDGTELTDQVNFTLIWSHFFQ